MKKLLICLLVLLCTIPTVSAEADVKPVLRMGLSKTRFTGPQDVVVTIIVTNPSEQEPLGPMALYWPDGRMIEEFGTPTLAAGEKRTWEGTWFVTEEQLKQGRVIFAIQYTYLLSDGSIGRKTQPYYVSVTWEKKTSQTAEIVLKGNPTTGFDWHCEADCEGFVDIEREYLVDWQPSFEEDIMPSGTGGHSRFTLQGVASGEVTITFTYRRPWENQTPPYTLVYRVCVDEELNVTILSSSFDW